MRFAYHAHHLSWYLADSQHTVPDYTLVASSSLSSNQSTVDLQEPRQVYRDTLPANSVVALCYTDTLSDVRVTSLSQVRDAHGDSILEITMLQPHWLVNSSPWSFPPTRRVQGRR